MADVRPFAAIRYDFQRFGLAELVCPPYDVISQAQAQSLRGRRYNAIHLELPEGEGRAKYEQAARLWARWRSEGVLVAESKPAFYAVEERFKLGSRGYSRSGFLAALGVTPEAAEDIIPHERTLSKPKEDRLEMLRAVKANISPIFGIFPDPGAAIRSALRRAATGRPVVSGQSALGVRYRLWRVSDPRTISSIRGRLAGRKILIADGHHRLEVGKAFYQENPSASAETILAYFCPEEDKGLVMLPTHRIVEGDLARREPEALSRCRLLPCSGRQALLKRLSASANPYAFGFFDDGFTLAVPRGSDGCRSGLCVEWIGKVLLHRHAPDAIRYTHDAAEAVETAKRDKAAAVFVKPAPVSQVRKAVKAIGLLPPKSTYFYPKIGTGLVFKGL
ncbi:MAG: DUF1015 domain-containing protein [Elusimicrobia bacterium]|nr:DUF1015 domain-containing protein [Elusimicrobiota bacterium]